MKLTQLLWLFISFFVYLIKLPAFIDKHLERQIELYDLFDSVNSFINYKNKKIDNIFELEKNRGTWRAPLNCWGSRSPSCQYF